LEDTRPTPQLKRRTNNWNYLQFIHIISNRIINNTRKMPHYRSRAIWDETRKENAPYTTYIRAILYELQPIRFSSINIHQIIHTTKSICLQIIQLTMILLRSLYHDVIKKLTLRDLKYFSMISGYVYVVLYIHR